MTSTIAAVIFLLSLVICSIIIFFQYQRTKPHKILNIAGNNVKILFHKSCEIKELPTLQQCLEFAYNQLKDNYGTIKANKTFNNLRIEFYGKDHRFAARDSSRTFGLTKTMPVFLWKRELTALVRLANGNRIGGTATIHEIIEHFASKAIYGSLDRNHKNRDLGDLSLKIDNWIFKNSL